MIDVALIEMEGVLFETTELRRASLRDALQAQRIELPVDGETVDGLAPRVAAQATLAFTEMEHDDVLLDLIALRAERSFSAAIATSGAGLSAGARPFIERAAVQGRLGIVTRMARADAGLLLRLADLDGLITTIVGGDDVIDGKPSFDGYRLALSRLRRQRGEEPSSVIALEDGAPGIRAARMAGIRCVAVGSVAPHVAIEADAYVASLDGQTLRSLDVLSAPGRERVQ